MGTALTVAKQTNFPDAGTITVDMTVPRDGGIETTVNATMVTGVVGPCSVIFNADVSASNFSCKNGLDPVTGETFTNVWQVKDQELEYYWNNGEDPAAYWPEVGPVVPLRFSLKAPMRGRKAEHHYTQPGTYNWTLMVVDPHTNMVGFAEGTIVIVSALAVATRIVLVNHNDTDFSAFDATGLAGTVYTYNLAGAQFNASHAAYTDHKNFDNVVWCFKGFDELGDIYDWNLVVDGSTSGHTHLFTSYGAGRWTLNVPNYTRRLALIGNGAALEPKPFRMERAHLKGNFDNVNDPILQSTTYAMDVSSPNWWFILHDVKSSNWGGDGGVINAEAEINSWLSLGGCVIADTGGEYSILMTGGETSRFYATGCFMYDQWDRWAPDGGDNKNSMIRHSGPQVFILSKSRIFVMRRGSLQSCAKIGNGGTIMDYGHVYFNVLEAVTIGIGIYSASNKGFNEVNCIVECNLFFGTPWSNTVVSAHADGWTMRYNACIHVAWLVNKSQNDTTIRLRHLATVSFVDDTNEPPLSYYVGAPIRIYGNTIVSDLTVLQNANNNFSQMILVNKAVGPEWDGFTPDEWLVAETYEDQNLIYTPNMTLPAWQVAGPMDYLPTSTDGPVGTTGEYIHPMFKGWRATQGGPVDTDYDQSHGNAPSFKLDPSSPYFKESASRPRPIFCDWLGNIRAPKSSRGAAEDTGDTRIAGLPQVY